MLLLRREGDSNALGYISNDISNIVRGMKKVIIKTIRKHNCMCFVDSLSSQEMLTNERIPLKVIGNLNQQRIEIKEEKMLYFTRYLKILDIHFIHIFVQQYCRL